MKHSAHFATTSINIVQHEHFTVSTNADNKLNALRECPISRSRRTEFDKSLNEIEKS